MKINDSTNIALPIRNLVAIAVAVALGVWGYFGVIERLNQLETKNQLFEKDLKILLEILNFLMEMVNTND